MDYDQRHREGAIEHLGYAFNAQIELDSLRNQHDVPDRNAKIAQLHQEIGHALKVAHIEATLDVAAAFRGWTEMSDPPEPERPTLIRPLFRSPAEDVDQ